MGFRLASSVVTTTLTPTFGASTSTADGFTVPITNFDSSYTWAGTATASGSVSVSGTGLVTVTGVNFWTSSTATITTTKLNTVGGSAQVTAVPMSMVTVGDVGNVAKTFSFGYDIPTKQYGAVAYSYQIGAYDVTGSQYAAFLNAVGSTDTHGLYNANMGTDTNVAQISRSGTSGTYTYAVMNGTGRRPITYVSWFDSARFSNWMSNGQPSGAQVSTTTENGAYNLSGTSRNAVAKNTTNPNTGLAPTYRIPLENEWFKAAYYSPDYSGAGVGGYYTYATQSNSEPGNTIGSGANQANYDVRFYGSIGHASNVGAFSGSGSFYGTFDQSGNVYQWNDLAGNSAATSGVRGGSWTDNSDYVSSSYQDEYHYVGTTDEVYYIGFRLASPV
jgi:formylglycine-generating enzyme required for sulfatase activity